MSLPITTTWTHLKDIVDSKDLPIQYEYNTDGYYVFAVDGIVIYSTVIYNNAVPDPTVYSQVQNDLDKAEFLTTYQPISNRIMSPNAVRDGFQVTTNPMLVAGQDGSSIARIFRTDTNGQTVVVGSGLAGAPAGGVLTIQGAADGYPLPVSIAGSITATNPSVSSNNASAPTSSTQIGGTDGTNLQAARVYDTDSAGGTEYTLGVNLRKSSGGGSVEFGTSTDPVRVDPTGTTAQPVTDNGGSLTVDGTVAATQSGTWTVTAEQPTAANLNAQVQGTAADGATPVGNPVLTAGYDGTNVQTLLTDTAGRQQVVGAAADGAAVTGNPVLIAGQDGTNVQSLSTDGYGSLVIAGRDGVGTPPTNNPIVVAGWDGTNVVRFRLNTDGTVATSDSQSPTFTALATNIGIGNNKSMFSIVNGSGSSVVAKIEAIYVTSVQTAPVTGIVGFFEIRRAVNHSSGTAITAIETMDTNDVLNGSITVRTNATITSESANLLWRSMFSTEELAGNAAADTAVVGKFFSQHIPVFKRQDLNNKHLTLRANEGLTVKFVTNSTAGTFDIMVVFSQE